MKANGVAKKMPLPKKIGFGKKKKIEGDIVVDNPDIKVVSVTFEGKPFVIGIGTTEERQVEGEGSLDVKGGKGKYQSQKAVAWKMLYDPKVLPNMMPLENLKIFAASTVAVTSGDASVLSAGEFREEKPEKLKGIENRLAMYRLRKIKYRRNLMEAKKLDNRLINELAMYRSDKNKAETRENQESQ